MARNYILILQPDGSFIATSTRHPTAMGAGGTEEEALKNLEEYIARRSFVIRHSSSLSRWLHQILSRSSRGKQVAEERRDKSLCQFFQQLTAIRVSSREYSLLGI